MMRFYEEYTHIVAISEHSAGNDSVGSEWLETKVFQKGIPVEDIIKWANQKGTGGKLVITVSEP